MMDLNALDRQIKEVLPNALQDRYHYDGEILFVTYVVGGQLPNAETIDALKVLMEKVTSAYPFLRLDIDWQVGKRKLFITK